MTASPAFRSRTGLLKFDLVQPGYPGWPLPKYIRPKGASQKKNTGVFPKCRTPHPPYLGGLRPKKIEGLFCVLGPKEHFWFLQKCSLFVSILTYTFGNRKHSLPLMEKFLNNPVFAVFSLSRIERLRPEISITFK